MTAGRRLLLDVLQHMTRDELARRCSQHGRRVTAQAIGRWASGRGAPTRYDHRVSLEREAGIALDSWEVSIETAVSLTRAKVTA